MGARAVFCVFLVALLLQLGWAQRRCNYDSLRRCEKNLNDQMNRPRSDFTRSDSTYLCKGFREEFSCVLWESMLCPEQRESSVLSRARQFLVDTCDKVDRGWRENPCFQREEVRRCDTDRRSGGTYNQDTCRTYSTFRECVENRVQDLCSYSDKQLVAFYVYDADPEGWKCSNGQSGGSGGRYEGNTGTYGSGGTYGGGSYGGSSYGSSSFGGELCCRREQCNTNRLTQCRDTLQRTTSSRRESTYSNQQTQCRDVRNSLNCLMWQNSNCGSRSEDSSLIQTARSFIDSNCKREGDWRGRSCYQQSDMQACERRLTESGSSYRTAESCREFNQFKECVSNVLKNRCAQDDDLYQSSYFIDQGGDKAWLCGGQQTGIDSRPPYSGGGGGSYGGGSYGGGSYGSSYGGYSSNYGDTDVDGNYCSNMVVSEAQWCLDTYTRRRRDSDEEMRKICCAAMDYEDCVKRAVENRCSGRGSDTTIYRLNEKVKGDIVSYCKGISKEQCSGAGYLASSLSLLIIGLATILKAMFI